MEGNIFLIGFSFTGKTLVGREVARQLGWPFVDTDEEIAELTGKPLQEIFQQDGEESFRQYERWALKRLQGQSNLVVATGGGAILDPGSRELMRQNGAIVCLDAQPETIYGRLQREMQTHPDLARPLLTTGDPLQRIRSLKEARQSFYALADWTVHTDHLTGSEAAEEVLRGCRFARRRSPEEHAGGGAAAASEGVAAPHFVVAAENVSYPAFVGRGLLTDLGSHMVEVGLRDKAYVVSDDSVFHSYGGQVMDSLKRAGFSADFFTVAPGEGSKTLQSAARIYDWLVSRRAERHDALVALGGGVVGDLAGFVAATFLRGMPFVQVPTTSLAMVDAAIGGKVAVNRSEAKNLVGAFYQPRLVLIDVATLDSLPSRELVAGWVETIKHAFILDPALVGLLERQAAALLKLEKDVSVEVVRRSAALKAKVVEEDPRETTGRRMILNYGHTIGHALEAATGYGRFLHGEAIAVGMMGAARLGRLLGITPQRVVARQRALLHRFGLPLKVAEVDLGAVRRAMELDKKTIGGSLRWVLLEDIGRPVIRDDVPAPLVDRVLRSLASPSAAQPRG